MLIQLFHGIKTNIYRLNAKEKKPKSCAICKTVSGEEGESIKHTNLTTTSHKFITWNSFTQGNVSVKPLNAFFFLTIYSQQKSRQKLQRRSFSQRLICSWNYSTSFVVTVVYRSSLCIILRRKTFNSLDKKLRQCGNVPLQIRFHCFSLPLK